MKLIYSTLQVFFVLDFFKFSVPLCIMSYQLFLCLIFSEVPSVMGTSFFFQVTSGIGSPKQITLNSRGLEDSKTSNWGLRPTVILGGDLVNILVLGSCDINDRDRVNGGLKFGFCCCCCTPNLLIFVLGLSIGRIVDVGCGIRPV